MASINKVTLLGNLGRDPETKTFENGGTVCTFSLATTESYFDREKNQRVDLPTEWHNIRIGRAGLAKVAQQYLRKGSQVYVEGSIRSREYQDKDGITRRFYEINVTDMVLLGGKPNGEQIPPAVTSTAEVPPIHMGADDDDLPF
ncbi:MAG: single-stranded DNA-binding protein [Flavobacteriales bacterium]|nr:single-stranded DNA-binding protein [Flavobacteriales bacterium]